ncbi:hypothetical protein [Hoeflea sp. TYP-13]|uniref:hypothetical protein n=1 Tax=Hoeflea sp. TYP-13 TaxID=3230023 RepID=UPI0034C65762
MLNVCKRLALMIALCLPSFPSLAAELSILARPGPWPVADNLVAYRGRIWFSAAVKGVDHNSADIWSFDPGTEELRFERYLFSQDAGRPSVHKGLLYWPHEDMRIGLGEGVISVTNGGKWAELFVATDDLMMHTHAAVEWKGKLVTAMAGWNSVLAASTDAGMSWTALVNDPPKTGSFHRYNDVVALDERLFVRHWQDTGLTLAEYRDGGVAAVDGWPKGRIFSALTPFAGALYALVESDSGKNELWRIATGRPERVEAAPEGLDMQHMISDGRSLWLVVRTDDGAQLWSSADGKTFTPGDTVRGGNVHSAMALAAGKIYLAGEGADGKAILWGPTDVSIVDVPDPIALPDQPREADPQFDEAAERNRLQAALSAPQNYARHGRPLHKIISMALARNPPSGFLASLLDAEVPDVDIEIFGGRFSVPARDIARWQILAAMAQRGEKTVPARLLTTRWQRQPNRPQKWFDALLIAMHAVQLSGQNDRATVDALIGRLDNSGDPFWLQSQVTGTLTAITGMDFAYDRDAWKRWWDIVKATWPQKSS